MTTIVSSFSPEGYELYGKRFVRTFLQYWPEDVKLVLYTEAETLGRFDDRVEFRDLNDLQDCMAFIKKFSVSKAATGRMPINGWKPVDVAKGYCYKFDAVKFCRKTFVIKDAAERLGVGRMAWIDADVVSLAPVPHDLIDRMLDGHDVAYLGRERRHSECGFVAFDLPKAGLLIDTWAGMYSSGRVFGLTEWHDSFVFDLARAEVTELTYRNITAGISRAHAWVDSPLGPFMDHCKGDRKIRGWSPERFA